MIDLSTDEALQRVLDEARSRAASISPEHARLGQTLTAATASKRGVVAA